MGATLSPQEKARVEATPTKNTAAYDAYLRGARCCGRAWRGQTSPTWRRRTAAVIPRGCGFGSPDFALAWAYLSAADSAALLEWKSIPTPRAIGGSQGRRRPGCRARAPSLPGRPIWRSAITAYYGLRTISKGALAEVPVGGESLPGGTSGYLRAIGLIQRRFGHWDEAIAVLRRVFALDPRNIQSAGLLAGCVAAKRNFSDALAVADHILAIEPSNAQAIGLKAFCFLGTRKSRCG